MLSRAQEFLDTGYHDEALRLAQIALRLEQSQRAKYAEGEERPSDFISRIQPAAVRTSTAAGRTARNNASPGVGGESPMQVSPPASGIPLDSADSSTPSVGNGAQGTRLDGSENTVKRFVRDPKRRKRSVVAPPRIAAPFAVEDQSQVPPPPDEILAPSNAAAASEAAADETPPADEPARESIETAAAPVDEDLGELPIVESAAPPAPRKSVRTWSWNATALAGMVSGLVMLVLLWVWRELERWHYRLTRSV